MSDGRFQLLDNETKATILSDLQTCRTPHAMHFISEAITYMFTSPDISEDMVCAFVSNLHDVSVEESMFSTAPYTSLQFGRVIHEVLVPQLVLTAEELERSTMALTKGKSVLLGLLVLGEEEVQKPNRSANATEAVCEERRGKGHEMMMSSHQRVDHDCWKRLLLSILSSNVLDS